ncbi:hypothetical protein ECC02_006066 [Trypanosoma cruzi]|uniref:Kinesin-like protein n=1 Tax=Trypanosoma cruzi TaxID=5693 RepID=A0A7J6Y3C6_TRYCR|nr:hypothetical protein ECC02_006066 [Trypanosoma cruzi]
MENIRVVVRVRPFLPNEGSSRCLTVRGHQVVIGDERQFAFDEVFDMDTMSHTVNDAVAMPLVSAFVNGYTVSTIAYGQTGAGKTFTMSSLSSDVVRRISAALKADVTAEGGEKPEFRVSAVELYNENICDLIASTISSSSSIAMASVASLSLREDPRCGVYIQGLSEVAVESEEELLAWVENSSANRRTASTMLNATSSRSHALLTITLTHNGVVSRFGLVDLAGSERFKKTYGRQRRTGSLEEFGNESNCMLTNDKAKGIEVASRIREGISINTGLLALGNVIVALCERKAHVPYRTSKLTRLLQPMLSGNSKTTIIACVSPDVSSFEETLNTLKYADRAKAIRTTPFQVASGFSSLEEAERTILSLRRQLGMAQQQLREEQLPIMYSFPVVDETQLEELQDLLTRERNLTRRLQEDLFNAEYTAMMEVEKRKQIEKRLLTLEAQQRCRLSQSIETDNTQLLDANLGEDGAGHTSSLAQNPAEHDEPQVPKAEEAVDAERLSISPEIISVSRNNIDESKLENLSREIQSKERLIHQLTNQNEDAVRELEYAKRRQQEMQDVKRHLEEELARAEAKLEATEMQRQGKEEERQKLQTHYQVRLRKAEEEAAEYRRKVQEATTIISGREANAEMMKQLQSQVVEMSDELNRQRHALREGQQRLHKVSASHSQEVNQLQKKLRDSEAQVARLQVQLQRKEREIARVKKGGAVVANRRQQTPTKTTTQQAHASNTPSVCLSEDLQKEIDVELISLINLEKELDELTADRDELRDSVREAQERAGGMTKWKDAMKGFMMRLQQLERNLHSEAINEEIRLEYSREKASIEEKLRQLELLEPVLAQASKQLEEMDNNIDSLQEARKYHLRRVRQMQNGTLTPVNPTVRASELLRRGVANHTEVV